MQFPVRELLTGAKPIRMTEGAHPSSEQRDGTCYASAACTTADPEPVEVADYGKGPSGFSRQGRAEV